MSQPRSYAAWAWLLVVALVVSHNLWLWAGQHIQLDTDVLAMLPQDEQDAELNDATRRLADAANQRVVVLVGAPDWPAAERAGDAFAARLADAHPPIELRYRLDGHAADGWIEFFSPYRHQLLTVAQRKHLQDSTIQALANEAVAALYRPMGMPRIGAWADDPLNLFGQWLAGRAGSSRVSLRDGRLMVADQQMQYAVLILTQHGSGFSAANSSALQQRLAQAATTARATGRHIDIVTAGVPLFAAAAAGTARHEIDTIGAGSLLGMLLLTWLAFRSLRPRLLVTLSIVVGLACAVSVCMLVFHHLHVITLVFGASLVGVAENYGSNYYSSRLGRPLAERWQMLREQKPTLWLAMLTTVIGYSLLALAPFPGLRQIAVFSATGLLGAFLTVLYWFPALDGGEMPFNHFASWLGGLRRHWPRLGRNRASAVFMLAMLAVSAAGLLRLHASDDIRQLQNAPAGLIADQRRIARLLDFPSPAQFYLLRGNDAEQLLQREEALKTRLDRLVADGLITGYQALSDWVPSAAQQKADARLYDDKIDAPGAALSLALAQLDENPHAVSTTAVVPLTLSKWLNQAGAEPFRGQWLGDLQGQATSVLLLHGVDDPKKLLRLAQQADGLAGVRWVDKVDEVSQIMARYRGLMGGVIAGAYGLVFVALLVRFGRHAWRALAPTALASVLTLALLGLAGQTLQLFNVLALLLILGMGVDYGIFLLQQPARQALRPFLSVTLAAVSTQLSFGLLALSSTPALRAFGLTMLFGIGLCWLLTPAFLPAVAKETHES